MQVPSTVDRVPRNTDEGTNARIQRQTEASVAWYAARPELLDQRLRELDREWDTERTLEANAAILGLAGIALGATRDRRWLVLPALVSAFLLQHAVQGWCPPLPLLRRLGFRTAREIDGERVALKALRGDFAAVGGRGASATSAADALSASRR